MYQNYVPKRNLYHENMVMADVSTSGVSRDSDIF